MSPAFVGQTPIADIRRQANPPIGYKIPYLVLHLVPIQDARSNSQKVTRGYSYDVHHPSSGAFVLTVISVFCLLGMLCLYRHLQRIDIVRDAIAAIGAIGDADIAFD